jgi:putative glutathione S-transferase
MLVDGQWTADWQPVQQKDAKGAFIRQDSQFRGWVTPDGAPGPSGDGGFPAEAGRYHLYVALICPWASRTLAVRALKRLEGAVDVTVLDPVMTPEGWRFGDGTRRAEPDPLHGATYLHEIYTRAAPRYTGRATVPVLWDKATGGIVNNESSEIIRMFDSGFGALADPAHRLYPEPLRAEIDRLNAAIYPRLNNGVYRAGFALTQEAYEAAFRDVFGMLDELERHLDGRDWLAGAALTEADIRLFVTLVRFDAAYHGLFKCNLRRLADYPRLSAHTRRMLDVEGIRGTVDIDHIKRGYYALKTLNPNGIVPAGPDLSPLGL